MSSLVGYGSSGKSFVSILCHISLLFLDEEVDDDLPMTHNNTVAFFNSAPPCPEVEMSKADDEPLLRDEDIEMSSVEATRLQPGGDDDDGIEQGMSWVRYCEFIELIS
jgi:hypothetical protein